MFGFEGTVPLGRRSVFVKNQFTPSVKNAKPVRLNAVAVNTEKIVDTVVVRRKRVGNENNMRHFEKYMALRGVLTTHRVGGGEHREIIAVTAVSVLRICGGVNCAVAEIPAKSRCAG